MSYFTWNISRIWKKYVQKNNIQIYADSFHFQSPYRTKKSNIPIFLNQKASVNIKPK